MKVNIPEPLQSIPEFIEMAAFFESGQVLPNEYVLEAEFVPPLSPENRKLLATYLQEVDDNTEYMTEHQAFQDKDIVLAITMRSENAMLLCAKFGLLPRS